MNVKIKFIKNNKKTMSFLVNANDIKKAIKKYEKNKDKIEFTTYFGTKVTQFPYHGEMNIEIVHIKY